MKKKKLAFLAFVIIAVALLLETGILKSVNDSNTYQMSEVLLDRVITVLNKNDENEVKADRQAYSWMVNEDYYKYCLKPGYDIELENSYPKSFVLYRLAKDGYIKYYDGKYQKYNILID